MRTRSFLDISAQSGGQVTTVVAAESGKKSFIFKAFKNDYLEIRHTIGTYTFTKPPDHIYLKLTKSHFGILYQEKSGIPNKIFFRLNIIILRTRFPSAAFGGRSRRHPQVLGRLSFNLRFFKRPVGKTLLIGDRGFCLFTFLMPLE
jgi:hypothetical protein